MTRSERKFLRGFVVGLIFGILACFLAFFQCGCGAILESSDADDDCDAGADSSTPDEPDVQAETDQVDYLDVLPDEVVHPETTEADALDGETIEASDETDAGGDESTVPDETIEASDETDADVAEAESDAGPACSGPWEGSGAEGVHHVADMVILSSSSCYLNSCHDPFPYFEILVEGPLYVLSCSDCHGYGDAGPVCRIMPGLEDVAISISVRCIGGPCNWSFSVSCPCLDA